MKEVLKIINECVLSNLDKVKTLNKLDELREILYSSYETHHFCNNLFELIDEISLMVINRRSDDDNNPMSVINDRDKESEIVNKFNELRNSILNILMEESNTMFVAE